MGSEGIRQYERTASREKIELDREHHSVSKVTQIHRTMVYYLDTMLT